MMKIGYDKCGRFFKQCTQLKPKKTTVYNYSEINM